MLVWRLTASRFAQSLDGAGNRDSGARWNSGGGRGVVYCSTDLALCVLEVFVHLGAAQRLRLPKSLTAVCLDVPDDGGLLVIVRADIPSGQTIRDRRGRTWSQTRGDDWLDRGAELALSAPSAIVPQSTNIMLNPAHPRMADVRILSLEEFALDPRLANAPVS